MISNVIDEYESRICDMYLKTHPNANSNEVKRIVSEFSAMHLRDIPCELHNNITHERIDTTVSQTFGWISEANPIISGNATFYKQHGELLSPAIKMLEHDQKDRALKKKEMFKYPKGSPQYKNLNVGQGNVKVIMNADYGGSGTTMSPFFSIYIPKSTTASAKNLTTTLICCLELLSCNTDKWCKLQSFNELMDMIHAVLFDNEEDRIITTKGRDYSPNEVCQRLVNMVDNITPTDVRTLQQYLSALSPYELKKLMLANNIKLALTEYLYAEIGIISDYLKQHPVDFNDITKESLSLSGYGVKQPDAVSDVFDVVNKFICDNCVYNFMPNDPEARTERMERDVVCVTDTDSLMVHFAHFIKEFQCDVGNHKASCILASAIGMRIYIENVIPKFVHYWTINCNIQDPYYQAKFEFKNEFAFLSMTLFAKKMYSASMFVQEGTPRDPHEVAVTGLSFKKRDAAEFLEPVMVRLYDQYILTSDRVYPEKILDEYYALRSKISNEILTDTGYFKVLSIRDIKDYDPNKVLPNQMRGAIVWNNIMPDEEMLPMDRVIVVPLSFELLQQNQSKDPRIAEILRICLVDNEKMKHDPFICLPEHYHVVPDWVSPVIDVEKTVDSLLSPFKQILGLFRVNIVDTRGGMIPSRMVML